MSEIITNNKLIAATMPAWASDIHHSSRGKAVVPALVRGVTAAESGFQSTGYIMTTCAAFAASLLVTLVATGEPASALVPQANGALQHQMRLQDELITEVRARGGGAVRRTTVTGPRGNTASRTVARGGAVVRPGVGPGVARAGWVRPANYYWRPGGAIAAGAAIGFVTAATAAAWAGSPPAPGYCWYYSDPSRTQGFWDVCP